MFGREHAPLTEEITHPFDTFCHGWHTPASSKDTRPDQPRGVCPREEEVTV